MVTIIIFLFPSNPLYPFSNTNLSILYNVNSFFINLDRTLFCVATYYYNQKYKRKKESRSISEF